MCLNTQNWYYFLPSIQSSVIYPMKVQHKAVKLSLVTPATPESTPESTPPPAPTATEGVPGESTPSGDRRLADSTEPQVLCSSSLKSQINQYSQYELCNQQPLQVCGERVVGASVIESFIGNTPLFEQPKPQPAPKAETPPKGPKNQT